MVIRLSSLGDVVLTAPVYRSLKAHWPDASISVLVKPQFAPALEGNPALDEVIPYAGMPDALRRIRSGGFTHLLDLHDNPRSFLLRSLSGVPRRSVYRKGALARRLFVACGLSSPALQKHTVEKYLEALKPWGVPALGAELTLDDHREGRRPLDAEEPRRIVVLQSAFLGDALLTIPLLREVKSLYPRCRLSVVTLPGHAEVFSGSPWVDEVIADDKRGAHGGPRGLWSLARELRRRRFELALVPHRSLRSALLAWLAGVPRRIGFTSSAGRFLFTRTVAFSWLMHDLERNLSLLLPLHAGLKVSPDAARYLDAETGPAASIQDRLIAAGIAAGQRLVAVHPGSKWETKRWFPERFAEVCRRMAEGGAKVVLVGGREDAGLCASISQASGALDWSGRTTLSELKALMGRLSLFITNDSGPMHVAAASGVPTLALFGPTTKELGFFPFGPRHRVLEAELDCRPCTLHGGRSCPHGHFLCMRLITVEDVLKNAEQMLAPAAVS